MYNESYLSLGGTLVTLPDGTRQFNAMDNIGSVRLTVSVNGQDIATEHFDYKPFGDTLNAEDESRIGYAAQERDEESRYFAMGARQYDPLSGRFLSVDPLYESFPDKTPYHYCNNNPISFKDPSGLSPEGEKGKEDEVQENYEGDRDESESLANELRQEMEDDRNSKKALQLTVGDGEAMSDASRQRMQDFGGSGGQGFNNSGWESILGDEEDDGEGDRTGPEGEEVAANGVKTTKFVNIDGEVIHEEVIEGSEGKTYYVSSGMLEAATELDGDNIDWSQLQGNEWGDKNKWYAGGLASSHWYYKGNWCWSIGDGGVSVGNGAIEDNSFDLAGIIGIGAALIKGVAKGIIKAVFKNSSSYSLHPEIVLNGGRSGQYVKDLTGPANSVLKGSNGRIFITNNSGHVIWDITMKRAKSVIPGQGFGIKIAPSQEQLNLIRKIWGE